MRTLPTLDPMVTPRWLRTQRQGRRRALRLRDSAEAAGRPFRQIGDYYFLGPRKSVAQLAAEQGVGPFDPERMSLWEHVPAEEWDDFLAAIEDGRARPT